MAGPVDTGSSVRPSLDVDPWDEAVLADPLPIHTQVREAAPVVWLPRRQVWMTGRDEIVREVLTDPARFSSAAGVGLVNLRHESSWQRPSVILEVDPPEHAAVRRVLNSVLSPRAMRRLRDDFRQVADRLVDEVVGRGEIDGIADLAFRFPFTVLPDAVGMQAEGREHLMSYSRMYFDNRAPDTRLARESTAAAEAAGSLDWVREQCRRERLTPDGFGAEIYAAADRGEIDDDTASSLIRSFLGGGIDTTVLVLGSLLHALACDPEQWRLLRDDHALVRAAFDEALRLAPAAAVIVRTTTGSTELGGIPVGSDQKVVCSVLAANRDPRRWDDPDRFDVGRSTAGQLGFGLGPHFCVGHATARLEAECLIGAMVERVERIELTGPPTPTLNNWLHGPASLPIRLVAA